MWTTRFLLITGMILAAAASRLIPHPPNFTPVAAIALFAGASLSRKWQAFLVPLAAMALSDVFIFRSHAQEQDVNAYLFMRSVVYGCFAVAVCMGFWLRSRRTVLPIAGAALAGSVLFFVVTNFAVWLSGGGFSYARDLPGLIQCYVAAIPFFHYTVLSDLLFAGVAFGGLALFEHLQPELREARPVPAAETGAEPTAVMQEEFIASDK